MAVNFESIPEEFYVAAFFNNIAIESRVEMDQIIAGWYDKGVLEKIPNAAAGMY